METVLIALMMVVCFNFVVKQTFCKWLFVAGIAFVVALFVGLMWPYAIEQSKTQLALWLADAQLMLDLSVILTVEVALQMAFCMVAAHVMTSDVLPRRTIWLYKALRWFPGLLIFPVLFTTLVWAIFSLPGVSFSLVAWGLALVVLLLVPAGVWFVRWLLPEKELRLEILFLTNALAAILGVIATVNGRTAVAGVSEVDWAALAALGALLLLGGVMGLILFRNRKIKSPR